jgi:hypothetical protein
MIEELMEALKMIGTVLVFGFLLVSLIAFMRYKSP